MWSPDSSLRFTRAIAALALAALTSGCFQPLYGEHTVGGGPILRDQLAAVDVLHIPRNKVFNNLDRYGNTSAASVPIALHEALSEGLIAPGDKVFLCSFGAGVTWGAALVEWS